MKIFIVCCDDFLNRADCTAPATTTGTSTGSTSRGSEASQDNDDDDDGEEDEEEDEEDSSGEANEAWPPAPFASAPIIMVIALRIIFALARFSASLTPRASYTCECRYA